MINESITLSAVTKADIDKVNQIIESAIRCWNLPERVKRLSIPSYLYNEWDLQQFDIVVAKQSDTIIGVASWQQASNKDTPKQQNGLLLHGLYVQPEFQNKTAGKQLLHAAEASARDKGLNGLLVKAHKDATTFFIKNNFEAVKSAHAPNQYTYLFWKKL